ncbi:hypothetical protein EW093_11890 [Thiospirochaeta perfilievii]|uniref:Lycopene cyclase domain-containing protein n=1 Tax=Thiospirochaeta perfilievii TaxID=252967 RepID=A0A5C1QGM6_9SPIO|nr:hypothetical protein [Thiospirochaeta perfilievii]QEN05382.1 hypothetical protein EW093_11890 [Thiospirochaeta perfilievii]
MTNQMVVAIIIKLFFGFLAALTSLLLWSKTRDGAWLLMVLGVVFLYLETLLQILDSFGFILYKKIEFSSIPILPLIFEVVPFFFFALGMFVFLLRIRRFK